MDVDRPESPNEPVTEVHNPEEGEIVEEGGIDSIGVNQDFDNDSQGPLSIDDANGSQDQNEEGEHADADANNDV